MLSGLKLGRAIQSDQDSPRKGNSYFIETLEGHKLAKALKGRYLKGYFPSV
jgi:hypothetical protein